VRAAGREVGGDGCELHLQVLETLSLQDQGQDARLGFVRHQARRADLRDSPRQPIGAGQMAHVHLAPDVGDPVHPRGEVLSQDRPGQGPRGVADDRVRDDVGLTQRLQRTPLHRAVGTPAGHDEIDRTRQESTQRDRIPGPAFICRTRPGHIHFDHTSG